MKSADPSQDDTRASQHGLTTAKKESILVHSLCGLLENYREEHSSHQLPSRDTSIETNVTDQNQKLLDTRNQSVSGQRASSFSLPTAGSKSSNQATTGKGKVSKSESEGKR